MTSNLRPRIDDIPHSDGWWHDYNADTYEELGERLIASGLTEDEVIDILATAFHAAAAEFGS